MILAKYIIYFILIVLVVIGITGYFFLQSIQPKYSSLEKFPTTFKAKRLIGQPIIDQLISPLLRIETGELGYANINGPSLIRVPNWVKNPLGKYYLYFAHHKGSFIKMAFADTLAGPWTMYEGKPLTLEHSTMQTEQGRDVDLSTLRKYNQWTETLALIEVGKAYKKVTDAKAAKSNTTYTSTTIPHIASPEVVVDGDPKEIRMYFHGVVEGSLQKSKVAISTDGLSFQAKPEIISLPYLRMWKHKGYHYGLAMPGFLYRSKDGISNFEVRRRWVFDTNVRHCDIYRDGGDLYIFYSQVGDEPERIKYTYMDIGNANWNNWKVTKPKDLIRSSRQWEGSELPTQPSVRGEIEELVNQLRDPNIFEDEDGRLYLLYAGGGEQAIGIALLEKMK